MPSVEVLVWEPSAGLRHGGEELLDRPGVTWVDVQQPDEATLLKLKERFGLHPLEIEDCLQLDQRPKLEDYPGHEFLVTQGFCADAHDPTKLQLHEMHTLIGDGWVITVHDKQHPAAARVRERVLREPQETLAKGPDFLAYLVIDGIVDENFPLIDRFNDLLEELEESIFAGPAHSHLRRTFELKRALVQVRRVLSPQRDVVGLLSKRGVPHVQEKTALYFRDVFDHLVRLYEQIDASRDLLGNAMEAWLSVQANRTGEVTKQLTVIATIFLPLSFVSGFFGQNFAQIQTPFFFYVMLFTMAAIPISMIWWFRHKRWL